MAPSIFNVLYVSGSSRACRQRRITLPSHAVLPPCRSIILGIPPLSLRMLCERFSELFFHKSKTQRFSANQFVFRLWKKGVLTMVPSIFNVLYVSGSSRACRQRRITLPSHAVLPPCRSIILGIPLSSSPLTLSSSWPACRSFSAVEERRSRDGTFSFQCLICAQLIPCLSAASHDSSLACCASSLSFHNPWHPSPLVTLDTVIVMACLLLMLFHFFP